MLDKKLYWRICLLLMVLKLLGGEVYLMALCTINYPMSWPRWCHKVMLEVSPNDHMVIKSFLTVFWDTKRYEYMSGSGPWAQLDNCILEHHYPREEKAIARLWLQKLRLEGTWGQWSQTCFCSLYWVGFSILREGSQWWSRSEEKKQEGIRILRA